MPSYAAGPRPATVRLAQTSSQCIKETFNRFLPLPSSATRPANSVAPKPQIIARNRVRPRRSHKPSRSNLHSAPQPPASLTAVSFPGGFRTPAPVQAASSRWAVIRNPSQQRSLNCPTLRTLIFGWRSVWVMLAAPFVLVAGEQYASARLALCRRRERTGG